MTAATWAATQRCLQSLSKTAVNLLEHCRLVSLGDRKSARVYLERDEADPDYNFTDKYRIDTPFTMVGDSFIIAEQRTSQAQAYIVENATSIVIAFRGSGVKKKNGESDVVGTFDNAIADLKVRLIKDRKFPGKVHQGFANEYMQLKDQIHERFEQTEYNRRSRPKAIYVTGFSLGGALAILCAYDLAEEYDINPQCYLFAAPAAGDHDFTHKIEDRVERIFRFAHVKDVVPQIPHGIFCSYKATGGKLLVFDDDGRQVHHDKIGLALKPKRILAAVVIAKITRTSVIAALLPTIIKVAYRFKYHSPEYYKKKLTNLHLNYDEKKAKSSMRQAADKQYQECQQVCIDI